MMPSALAVRVGPPCSGVLNVPLWSAITAWTATSFQYSTASLPDAADVTQADKATRQSNNDARIENPLREVRFIFGLVFITDHGLLPLFDSRSAISDSRL